MWYDISLSAVNNSLSRSNHFPAAEYMNTLAFAVRLLQFAISVRGRYLMVPFHTEWGYDLRNSGLRSPYFKGTGKGIGSSSESVFGWGAIDGEALDAEDS